MNRNDLGIASLLFSGALLTGGAVCLICDAALSGNLTWSRIPASSIAYAWAVLLPALARGKRGIPWSLLSLSLFTIPYLYVLSRLTKTPAVFSAGSVIAGISLVFLWLLFALFKRMGKNALGGAFLLAALFTLAVNGALSAITAAPFLDLWNGLSISALMILAVFSFAWRHIRKHG